MNVRSIVFAEIERVAAEQKRKLVPLTEATPLLDSGLDSLCFAILIARLEDITGADPFAVADGAPLPDTIGSLIEFYEHVSA